MRAERGKGAGCSFCTRTLSFGLFSLTAVIILRMGRTARRGEKGREAVLRLERCC